MALAGYVNSAYAQDRPSVLPMEETDELTKWLFVMVLVISPITLVVVFVLMVLRNYGKRELMSVHNSHRCQWIKQNFVDWCIKVFNFIVCMSGFLSYLVFKNRRQRKKKKHAIPLA